MSKARHVSETPATQFLKQNKVAYTEHTYDYVDPVSYTHLTLPTILLV